MLSAFVGVGLRDGRRHHLATASAVGRQYDSYHIAPPELKSTHLAIPVPLQVDGVLSNEDIGVGVLIAASLALLASYVQRSGRQSTEILLRDEQGDLDGDGENEGSALFSAEAWKDISRPENYVLYNTQVRNQLKKQDRPWTNADFFRIGNKGSAIALLVLFLPIFFFEIFLALSRQAVCNEDFLSHNAWALELCSPHYQA